MKRITITVEEAIYDKLPKYGKSGVINVVLRNYYQSEASDRLYDAIKKKLMADKDMSEWIEFTIREVH